MNNDAALRQMLSRSLAWGDAHITFEKAVDGLPPHARAMRLDGFPHSLWDLVEHLRITQSDILAFCRSGEYVELDWPEEYWPGRGTPAAGAWDSCIAAFLEDRATLQALALDESIDLLAVVPHGTEQTYLRELLLVVDHDAYHLGQIVALRQALGFWPTG